MAIVEVTIAIAFFSAAAYPRRGLVPYAPGNKGLAPDRSGPWKEVEVSHW
jgi:hypothetical protein